MCRIGNEAPKTFDDEIWILEPVDVVIGSHNSFQIKRQSLASGLSIEWPISPLDDKTGAVPILLGVESPNSPIQNRCPIMTNAFHREAFCFPIRMPA